MTENLIEATLVMIEPVSVRIVHCPNIDNDVAGVEDMGISTAFQIGIPISVCLAQKENGKCFVAMKSTVVGSNADEFGRCSGGVHFLPFCRWVRRRRSSRHERLMRQHTTAPGRVDDPSTAED